MPKSQPVYDAAGEMQLMSDLWSPDIADDLRTFVRYVYPWGQPNTPLAHLAGPRNWQDAILKDMSDYIASARTHRQIHRVLPAMFKGAVASGRGIGKSALFSWLAHWNLSTRLGSSTWVTANGEPQLKTKTFPEISKWVSMAINAHWFEVQATKIFPAEWFAEAVQRDMKIDPAYWYITAQLWSEENPDAFAGAHNVYGEMYLFDEASGIPSPIWTVAEGVFTEEIIDRYWLAFSNPRRNSGAFFECFHKDRENWRRWQIDARDVDGTTKDAYESIIRKYGPDSDEARVEVYGKFPNSGVNQLIPLDLVLAAQQREAYDDRGAPLLLGVDVARRGANKSVLAFRKGRDARSIPWQSIQGRETPAVATAVAEAAQKYNVDAIFVDGNGVGGGVVDALKQWGYRVIDVQSGGSAIDKAKYKNKRAEMWGLMRDWLEIGSIPGGETLKDDLIGPEFQYDAVTNQIILESKEHMLERGVASPDEGDALAMTFAKPIARTDMHASNSAVSRRATIARGVNYDILG